MIQQPWKEELKNSLKKIVFFYLLGSLIVSLILFFIFTDGVSKIKNLLAKTFEPIKLDNLPLSKINDIKNKFYQITSPLKEKIDNLSQETQQLIKTIESWPAKINQTRQKWQQNFETLTGKTKVLENISLQTKINEPLYFFVRKEKFNQIIIDWGDAQENLELKQDMLLKHSWKNSGIYQVIMELKNERQSKKYRFEVQVQK